MRNPFYHEFAIGWNWWMIVIPLLAVGMLVLGWQAVYVRGGLARGRYNRRLGRFAAVIAAAIITFLVIIESGDGILQLLLNGLERNESPFWALIVMAILGGIAAIGLWAVLVLLSDAGTNWHLWSLRRQGIKFAPRRRPTQDRPQPTTANRK